MVGHGAGRLIDPALSGARGHPERLDDLQPGGAAGQPVRHLLGLVPGRPGDGERGQVAGLHRLRRVGQPLVCGDPVHQPARRHLAGVPHPPDQLAQRRPVAAGRLGERVQHHLEHGTSQPPGTDSPTPQPTLRPQVCKES